MKMNIIYAVTLIIISLIIISCDNDNQQEQVQKTPEQVQNQAQDSSQNTQQQVGSESISLPSEAIPPEKLELILPKSFIGARRLPSNYGKFNDDGKIWTTASVEFSFSKPGGVVVQIFDYGSLKNVPEEELTYIDKLPEEIGYQTDRITIPNGRGYLKWDKEYRRGKLRLLYLDRFIIKIDGTNMPVDAPGLEVFLNKFNFNLIK